MVGDGLRTRHLAGVVVLAGALACAGRGPAPAPPPAPAGPPFLFYYQDQAGVHRLDARSGRDTLLLALPRQTLGTALSPDGSKLALSWTGPDSARLVLLDLATGTLRRLHAAGKSYRYSVAWSPDGTRLALGFSTQRRVGNLLVPAGGAILILSLAGQQRRSDCESSSMVYAWPVPDTLVVGDGRELYPVSLVGCRSEHALALQGKRGITFSPDGKRLFYYAATPVRRGQRTVTATELYVADRDGRRARRIIGDPYDPQHARWSPDGSRIAFDVRPPDVPGGRYIAVYEVSREQVRFFPSRTSAGMARDSDPVWVPSDGVQLVHDRVVAGRRQKILRTLALDPGAGPAGPAGAPGALQVEPTVLLEGDPLGMVWGWADRSHLVVVSDQWVRLVRADGAVIYEMPGGRSVLAVAGPAPEGSR